MRLLVFSVSAVGFLYKKRQIVFIDLRFGIVLIFPDKSGLLAVFTKRILR